MARVEEETIYRNAGMDLEPSLASVYTNREINTSNEAMVMDMLPPLMPDTSSQPRQVYDISEYEVKSYDVNNDRTQIEYQSPYDNMTPIVLTNDEIRRSVLYGRVIDLVLMPLNFLATDLTLILYIYYCQCGRLILLISYAGCFFTI
jgi:hypothetical protein